MADEARDRRVKLRGEVSGRDVRSLWAVITESGDLRIEGQDLGPEVERFFGGGNTEYEWDVLVRAPNVAQAVVALGGAPGDDVLTLLSQRYSGREAFCIEERLKASGVPTEFWSRIGD